MTDTCGPAVPASDASECLDAGVQLLVRASGPAREILTPEVIAFVAGLERRFGPRRRELLRARGQVQQRLDAGWLPDFLPATAALRQGDWRIAPVPEEIQDRRVEITGPVDRKMMIQALNSGAQVFMADFEDSLSPTWENVVQGQVNLRDAVRATIAFDDPRTGKAYRLQQRTAVLFVRPRGLHLEERHLRVDGRPVSASLFDFGLHFFHNARELLARGTRPYFYLPKLESHREAALWDDVFVHAQRELQIPRGTVKATVLIENVLAAFEMDEILHALREHSAGLNCGRWDYIFSCIKKFRARSDWVLPDRASVGMTRHFLRSYSRLLIETCHRRGAHAMGGMAAQIPIKDDAAANAAALERVRADKARESGDGHDGTWVAHPGLVALAREEFDRVLAGRPNQIDAEQQPARLTAADLLAVPVGAITEAGLRLNLEVGVRYLATWLCGNGCVPLHHLMEDAATAEISRAQVWQWVHHAARLHDGRAVDADLVRAILADELERLRQGLGAEAFDRGRYREAADLFLRLILAEVMPEWLTTEAYGAMAAPAATPSDIRSPVPANPKPTDLRPDMRCPYLDRDDLPAGRFAGIRRDYSPRDVQRLRGSLRIQHTLAEAGAARLWELLHGEPHVAALGALTGNQAMQMVKAGLQAIYLSGWQVAADANLSGHMYPDQSLYPSNSVPAVVKRINQALQRQDQIAHMEGDSATHWFAPIVADAEAGFGGPLNAFELMKSMIEAGAAGVHFEDQLASEKKCGHLGGKVLVPTQTFVRTLNAARLAADVSGVPTLLVARTDADAAALLTSDVDERDRPFLTGERTTEGFFGTRPGLGQAIARALAYAPYADLVWCETSRPDLQQARRFAEAVHAEFPGKLLAYNCSPSFHWKKNLDDAAIARFQRELNAMGYKFQFVTLAGFHALNHGMFELARGYRERGMAAYVELQQAEFDSEARGYTATKHQREVGTGYFDAVTQVVSQGRCSTTALSGSTEDEQFFEQQKKASA